MRGPRVGMWAGVSGGVWKDERSRPGPWPQGRRRPLAIVAAIIAVVVVRIAFAHLHSHIVLGAIVVLISLTGFYTTVRLNRQRLEQQRYTRGPGWFIGLTISKLPLTVARVAWLLLSLAILALGIFGIIGFH